MNRGGQRPATMATFRAPSTPGYPIQQPSQRIPYTMPTMGTSRTPAPLQIQQRGFPQQTTEPPDLSEFPALGSTPITASQTASVVTSEPAKDRKLAQPPMNHSPHLNGINNVDHSTSPSLAQSALPLGPTFPQTNHQQVLLSPADRWGLLGLISVLKQARESDLGLDMSQLGLDITAPGTLHTSFTSPFFPSSFNSGSALPSTYTEPTFEVPNVYPQSTKMLKLEALSEEALFLLFYSAPRDVLQEIAADGLYSRNWRFHKPTRLWITKDGHQSAMVKISGGEQGTYTVFNASSSPDGSYMYGREGREMTVLYQDLEERQYKGSEALQELGRSVAREQEREARHNQSQVLATTGRFMVQ